ncbi:tryptophan halogenase family protein [Parvularcula maris]|uniref:Tryptophan 7-halogenase n=1 Tax=Parvularcula maris TaxID=2965077 RepID=A0A9X2LAS3_9PROT|nr:tryptophan halogenase family protein [Parvularcula maris]MCQ8186103.1 tryptophan 7-halogenase [Parvularcula maris]
MKAEPIKNVVIVGGGTAGWMTAAALATVSQRTGLRIELIESDAIGTVGVGEATIPPIAQFNTLLGLDEAAFLSATEGTFKLGIEFRDWVRLGHSYMHPFGSYGRDMEALRFYQLWLRAQSIEPTPPLGTFCLSEVAARRNRFALPSRDPGDVLSSLAYAYHFDAGLYARFLRRHAEERGVVRTEARITGVSQDGETGFVESVVLDDGREIIGDLFIDCSGFRGLLIEEAMQAGYESWAHWLPCDRAVAAPCARTEPLLPYTQATARDAGWQWRIPLQHRTGNGYVYSSAHLGREDAEGALLSSLPGEPTGELRHLRFETGRRRRMWEGNVVAIGLSAGFLEPLESTSIHLIQTAIHKLIALFPDQRFAPIERDEFNRLMALQFEQVRDFLILHYIQTERRDTAFWRDVTAAEPPESLKRRIELFSSKGRIFRHQDELFDEDNWLAVLWGQGVRPSGYDPMTDGLPPQDLFRMLAGMHRSIERTADAMPQHAAFVSRYCPGTLDREGTP